MKKFESVEVPDSEVVGMAYGWLTLWMRGDENTIRAVGPVRDRNEALERLVAMAALSVAGTAFENDVYRVLRHEIPGGMVHLTINRLDKSAVHDWRDYQEIKNQLVGPECEAIELYPAESRLVDNANQFHLWCWLDPTFRVPVGYRDRAVSCISTGTTQQRPFGS